MIGPRRDTICKDDIFMSIAVLVSKDSKDPNTQVGACLVDSENRVLGTGYNGFPRDIPNTSLPWDRDGSLEDTKYAYVVHAEENAIDNCDKSRLNGSKLYVTLFPCNSCATKIVNNRVGEVIYLSDKYCGSPESIASRRLLALAGVKVREFKSDNEEITIDLRSQ